MAGLKSTLPLLVLLLALAGCASVPEFMPEEPIREAGSLPQALYSCGQYHALRPIERIQELKPYLTCIDEAHAAFAGRNPLDWPGFAIFREELGVQYRMLNDQAFSAVRADAVELGIQAVLRTLWRGDRLGSGEQEPSAEPYTEAERRAVRDYFPQTAIQLGAREWIASATLALSPELERLRAGIAGLSASVQPPGARPEFAEFALQAAECERIRRLERNARYLGQLWRDREGFNRVAAGSVEALAAEREFQQGLGRAKMALREARLQAGPRPIRLACR